MHDAGHKGHIGEGFDGWPEGRALLARLGNTTCKTIDLHHATTQAPAHSMFA